MNVCDVIQRCAAYSDVMIFFFENVKFFPSENHDKTGKLYWTGSIRVLLTLDPSLINDVKSSNIYFKYGKRWASSFDDNIELPNEEGGHILTMWAPITCFFLPTMWTKVQCTL